MKSIPSITIGIPAYNEAENIQSLLTSLLGQEESGIVIKEIIVVSDGSTDSTKRKVQELKSKKVTFIDDGKRLGKSARLDYIFRVCKGDVLILMDADIMIDDKYLLSKTVNHAKLKKTGIVGINALPLPAQSSFENIIETGVMIMKQTARTWNNGNNYLSFKGCFLVLDGNFAKSIHMPSEMVNNDAYMYFAAVQAGYSPAYLEQSKVYYRSPMTLKDHVKQSSRYQSSESELRKYFNLDWKKQYVIPRSVLVKSMVKVFIKRPLTMMQYIGVLLYTKMYKQTNLKSTWSIASSTKRKISL